VAAAGITAFGPLLGAWHAAQVPFILVSAALVPFTYLIGWELWRSRSVALGGAVLILLAGPFLVLYPQVNNIAVFGAAGAGAVWCAIRAVPASRYAPWLVASGALAGVATLTRVDGLLVLVAPITAWLARGAGARSWPALLAGLAAFGAVVAPWLIRDLVVFGAAFPSAGGHTLWITTYNQQFSIGSDPTPASYLAWGLPSIVGSKLAAWGELIGRVAVLLGGIFVLPFLYGLWTAWRRELAPFLVYFLVVFVAMGLVFTFHAPRGAFYHSAAAWLPFASPFAVASLPAAATAASRWWRFLGRPATHRFLIVAGLVGAIGLSLAGSAVLLGQWQAAHDRLEVAADYLRSHGATSDRVMAYDPAALHALTGNPGVAPPFDPFPVVSQVVRAYDVRWVVVTLAPGEMRDPLGLWDGASATDSIGSHPSFLPERPALEAPGVRVFEVNR
jgi:hypothetical protein